MSGSAQQLRRYRAVFLWLLVLSLLVLAALWIFPLLDGTAGKVPRIRAQPSKLDLDRVAKILSIATAAASLLGFFITNSLALQKARRERERDDVELELKRLEIERMRLELERDKRRK